MIFYILIILLLPYLLQVFALYRSINKVKLERFETNLDPKSKFSIIIPATNERFTLEQIIENLKNQTYPTDNFEVNLLFDGHEKNYEYFRIYVKNEILFNLSLSETSIGKKAALKTLIQNSKYSNILQLDADIAIPKTLLQAYDQLIRKNQPDCIIGGVKPQVEEIDDFVVKFFGIDFLALQSIQIATLTGKNAALANGANLCYTKEAFNLVSADLDKIKSESGDDTFLVQFLNKAGKKIVWGSIPESHVVTPIPQRISEFLNQRARWGSKTREYINLNLKILAYLTFLANISLLLSIFFLFTGKVILVSVLFLFGIKGLIDYLILSKTAFLYEQNFLLKNFIVNSLLYPFFLVTAAFKAIFGLYTWK